jgi:DNA (cytosine-5)-methyltransferase 1
MSDSIPSPHSPARFGFVDLFSGAGGMSYGFFKHAGFEILAAADAEVGKPSMGHGALQCNSTYSANMGVHPVRVDLSGVEPRELRKVLKIGDARVHVLSVCPPCTGFSRTNPLNHVRDDRRNNLVRRAAHFAAALEADVVVMENARELIRGNFSGHFSDFRSHLESCGYRVAADTFMLSRFGVPQVRERAIVIAARRGLSLHTLEDLWRGLCVDHAAVTVRSAWAQLPADASARDQFPSFADARVSARLAAVPRNGGSWIDLAGHRDADELLTGAMKRILKRGNLGSHPDVYGRLWWDRPAPTIKRECAHTGNGRYAHPEEDRLCSIREMACLQGFPSEFRFAGTSLSNNYRHIGDAVPPLISYQLAHVCHWILTGIRPRTADAILAGTHLRKTHLRAVAGE